MTSAQKPWMSPKEVAAEHGCNVHLIWNRINAGDIPHRVLGRRKFIPLWWVRGEAAIPDFRLGG
jgi:hypothetical protein